MAHMDDYEDSLLASPSNGLSKGPADLPASGSEKRPSLVPGNDLKLVVKLAEGDVDNEFFDSLLLELSNMRRSVPPHESQPWFKGSGYSLGVGWFHAADNTSLVWLTHSLKIIQESCVIPEFTVSPFIPIPQLRRTILSVPNVPRLSKDGPSIVLQTISRLNRNLNTKFWKIVKILPLSNGKYSVIVAMDEKSIHQIESQSKIYYALSQVYVKVHAKNE